jgi:hypothetical protein
MDIETAVAIDTLGTDIRRVDRALTARIDGLEHSLTARIDSVESSLTGKIEHLETSLTAKMDEHKRHADVQFESIHSDIRRLAEHLVSLTVKVDSLLR